MKKELTRMLITALASVADWLCFRQIFLKAPAGYLKFSYIVLLIGAGASLLFMFGFFTRRFFVKQV